MLVTFHASRQFLARSWKELLLPAGAFDVFSDLLFGQKSTRHGLDLNNISVQQAQLFTRKLGGMELNDFGQSLCSFFPY